MASDLVDGVSLDRVYDESFVRRCAEDAVGAITNLWHTEALTFWRSTIQRDREGSSRKFFPTVSFRCIDTLLLTLHENPDWLDDDVKDQLTSTWTPAIVRQELPKIDSSLDHQSGKKELNIFTLALFVQSLSRAVKLGFLPADLAETSRTNLAEAVRQLLSHPAMNPGRIGDEARPIRGKVVEIVRQALVMPVDEPLEPPVARTPHPFLLYHVCRALDLAGNSIALGTQEARSHSTMQFLTELARKSIERLIAKQPLGTLNPGDAIALAFCAGTLSLAGTPEDLPFILASIKTCFEHQDINGCWPLGRVVEKDKDITSNRIEIATYEVAWVLADALARRIERRECHSGVEPLRTFIERLWRAGKYTERSTMRLLSKALPRVGWCSDHAYGNEMIESWSSAGVLMSLASLQRLLHSQKQEVVLAGFATTWPSDPDWPKWLRWEKYRSDSEVDHDHPVLGYLDVQMVQPILRDPRRIPPQNPRSVSALLFCPPGTSKTTIVRGVADGLGWPLVVLSPGSFIEQGLEYIESQAKRIFDRLMQLSKVVVLFDECDELFRERKPLGESEQMRGIAAFVTASMLPKVQALHDRGQIVFFICTNNFETIDSAVKRGGRIDHLIGVGPPDLDARRRIISSTHAEWLKKAGHCEQQHAEVGLEALAADTERYTRPEVERATRILMQSAPWVGATEAENEARTIADRLRSSLTITDDEMHRFYMTRDAFSHAVTEAPLP